MYDYLGEESHHRQSHGHVWDVAAILIHAHQRHALLATYGYAVGAVLYIGTHLLEHLGEASIALHTTIIP